MDSVLIILFALLLTTLLAFFTGVFPYPFGLLVLLAFIAGRILYLQSGGRR